MRLIINELKKRYGDRCLRCGSQDTLCADHVISPRIGGSDELDNLQLLCRRCNSGKGKGAIDYRVSPPLVISPRTGTRRKPADVTECVHPVRLPAELYEAIKADADADDRSINWKIVECLRQCYGLPPAVRPSRAKRQAPTTEQ
jgi:hypothetical protein